MASTILTSFDQVGEASEAVAELRRNGFTSKTITVMSSEPHPEFEDHDDKGSQSIYAIVCAVLAGGAAIALTVGVSIKVGLVTGGMPLVSFWPFGIIVFETAALGTILGTLARTIYESGLGRPGALKVYDPIVSEGKILIAVECDDDNRASVASRAMTSHGGSELRRV